MFSIKVMVLWGEKKMLASFDVNPGFLLCPKKRKILFYTNNCIHCLRKQIPCFIPLTFEDLKTELCQAGCWAGKRDMDSEPGGLPAESPGRDGSHLTAALELSTTTADL